MANQSVILALVVGLALGGGVGYFSTRGSGGGSVALNESAGSCSTGGMAQSGNLLVFNGKEYGRDDLPPAIKNSLFELENETYQKRAGILKEFAVRMSLAKSYGKDTKELPTLHDLSHNKKVSDQEVRAFFDQNKQRFKDASFDQMKDQIKHYLQQSKMVQVFQQEVKTLEDANKLKILISKPIAPEVKLNLAGFPTMGPDSAKYTLVEASDYVCGHCQNIHGDVKKVLEKYKDKIKFVQINYSLRPNGDSGTYIRGAYCAQQQSQEKFWQYHNKAFEVLSDPRTYGEEKTADVRATDIAQSAGVDKSKFEKCLNSSEAKDAVDKTNKILSDVGVSGTPTFFLNNKKISLTQAGLEAALQEHM